MAPMRLRVLVLMLLLYLGADFSNPLMPGAVSFAPDDSVEGLRSSRSAAEVVPLGLPAALPLRLDTPREPIIAARIGRPPVAVPVVPRAPAHASLPEPAPPGDDG
jgi:hypothetical protein